LLKQQSIFKTYTFWYVLIGVLVFLSLFLPFRINVVNAGYSTNFIGGSSYHNDSKEILNGFGLKFFPFIPIGIYLLTTLFISFSKGKVTKVFALVSSFFLILSLLLLLVATTFTLNFGGARTIVKTGIGYYIMVFLSLIFIVIVCVNVTKTWKGNSNEMKLNYDLLDN
jgi:hypothetical protein